MNYSISRFKLTNSTLHFGPLTNFTNCHVQLNFQIHCHTQTFPSQLPFFTVSSLYDAYIKQNNETAKENWNRPRTTNMPLHECSRFSQHFSKNFFTHSSHHHLQKKSQTNTKRTFYKIPCFETLPSFGHHISKNINCFTSHFQYLIFR